MRKRLLKSGAGLISAAIISGGIPYQYVFTGTYAYAKEKDSVYLSSLSLSKSNIDFDQDIYYYTAVVDRDADEIKVRAKPKDEDSSVSIDGNYVDEGDNYKRTVELEDGSNLIKIKVTNSDEDSKTYTINVIKGEGQKDEVYLDSLKINDKDIDLSEAKTEYKTLVNEYTDKAVITAVPEQDNYEVMIDGGYVTKESGFKQNIDLSSGENPIIIKVKNKKNKDEREYLFNITRKDAFDSKTSQDNIYLDYIKIDDCRINLTKDSSDYSLNVKENTDKVYITAEPENINYKVKINDKIVEESDDYKDFFTLREGKNEFKILIQDIEREKQRIYTININRGETFALQNNEEKNIKINQWIQSDRGWSYIDSSGNKLKNTWFYDKSTGKEYYLKNDGIMAAGWQLINNRWYYLNWNGEKQTGWNFINNKWYYLDSRGEMQTGWVKDINGKWYYLYDDGAMAYSTIIDGYSINADGTMK